MATRTFAHSCLMHAAPERILSALARYEFFLEHRIHPNVVGVRFLGERAGNGVTQRIYRNSERVRLGPIPLTVSHTATNYRDAGGALVGEAFQFPGIHVTVRTRCTPQTSGATLVEETLLVEAPRMLMGTVFAQAKRAHEEKLAKLDAALAAS